jgi:hypothetical protein
MDDALWNLTVKTVFRDGFFIGLEKLRQQGTLSSADAGRVRASLFKYLAARVAESQRELHRIQAVLARLNAVCQEASHSTAPLPLVLTGPVTRLSADLAALDGWVISLYETDLTMLGVVNPTTRRQRPQEFARAMDRLWQKREAQLSYVKDASLFEEGAWGS